MSVHVWGGGVRRGERVWWRVGKRGHRWRRGKRDGTGVRWMVVLLLRRDMRP